MTEKQKKVYKQQNGLHRAIQKNAGDILHSANYRSTGKHIQHGTMSVKRHSLDVARCSLMLSKKLGIKCSQRELIRGALLHDYFLYDWHDKDHIKPFRLHGIHHPGIALKNAAKEYKISPREADIIKKHMWPLTIVPPMCREAWIVTAADKYCSFMETLHLHRGKNKCS